MKPTAPADVGDVARRSQADAHAAAMASRVEVRQMQHPAEHQAAERLLARIWADPMGSPLPTHVIRTLSLIGGYVAGAYDPDGELLGAAAGFLTDNTTELGPAHLHSHIAGVAEKARSRHVGYALKLHQRAWALARGITRITWTFDPLVARNAYFNLAKLGADAVLYFADFYGDMTDGINAGQGSDRLLAQWDLSSQSALRAIHGQPASTEAAGLRLVWPAGEGRLLLGTDARGGPHRIDPDGIVAAWNGPLACAVPTDIERMREADPRLALAWRQAVREVLGGAMQDGYRVTGFARPGYYLLLPGANSAVLTAASQEAEE